MSAEHNGERIATRAIIVTDGKVLLGKRARGHGVDQFALVGENLMKERHLNRQL